MEDSIMVSMADVASEADFGGPAWRWARSGCNRRGSVLLRSPYYPPVYYSPPQTYYQPPPSRLHLSYSNRHADMLFQLVSRRYQNKSTLITTNRAFGEWNEVSSRISQTASACSAVQVTGISMRDRT